MSRKELFDNRPYMSAWEDYPEGKRHTYVEVGQTFCIYPMKRDRFGIMCVLLISENRFGKIGVIKSISKYLGNQNLEDALPKAALAEAGVRLDYQNTRCFCETSGYEVVKLPCKAYLCKEWKIEQPGSAERILISLAGAVNMVKEGKIIDQAVQLHLLWLHSMEIGGQLRHSYGI